MKVLILSQNEISHNPRLLKAAEFFLERNNKVTVVNGVSGFGDRVSYERIKKAKDWTVIENIFDKRNILFTLRWMIISIIHKVIYFLWSKYNLKFGFPFVINKGLIFSKIPNEYFDIILINLVDSLPLASKIKAKTKSKFLIYDSQEYFEGQYQKYEYPKLRWVIEAERKFISNADLILGTTNAMVEKLSNKFSNKQIIRVRNIPYSTINIIKNRQSVVKLKLIWHGMSVNYNNCRGVQIIVRAIAKCKTDVELTLQGKRIEKDYNLIQEEAVKLGIWSKIEFKPNVDPDVIIQSLVNYDIGITGELPEEENQLLTSSNKFFDFIHAGLCTIVPDLPGLKESIEEYNTGLLYESGNVYELAQKIDYLGKNRQILEEYKNNSMIVRQELIWDKDFKKVEEILFC